MELFEASRQWATRPEDERFESLQALYDATKGYANTARENVVPVSIIRADVDRGDVVLTGKAGNPATFTHWSFGQLCQRVGAPAGYLRDLPATLAVQNLNHGLANYGDKAETASLLFHSNGHLLLRAFTSEKYARIWNWEVAERLLNLQTMGWEPARPDKRFDGGNPEECQVCYGTGKTITATTSNGRCKTCRGTGRAFPALYASDHDMFAFIRNRTAVIREPGNPDGLQRGVIVENSEVGASALKLTRFLYREMCGNNIIWGASKMLEISVRHVGDARHRWQGYQAELRRYLDSSASGDEAKIVSAKTCKIGDTKEQVLDRLFGIRSIGLSRKVLEAGYEATKPEQDGDPKTVWGMVQGLTRYSQLSGYTDKRTEIDRAAGKLLAADF